jgi:hypothetical protein
LKSRTNGKNIYTENEVISIFDFLIHNVEESWGHICQQIIDIPMETKCALSLLIFSLFIIGRVYTKPYQRLKNYEGRLEPLMWVYWCSCQLMIQTLVTGFHFIYPKELEIKWNNRSIFMSHLSFASYLTPIVIVSTRLYDKRQTSIDTYYTNIFLRENIFDNIIFSIF